jgi:hypothetical protein
MTDISYQIILPSVHIVLCAKFDLKENHNIKQEGDCVLLLYLSSITHMETHKYSCQNTKFN